MDPVSDAQASRSGRVDSLPPVDGGVDRFRSLFDLHLDPVWRFVRRRCGSTEDADEVVAETFAVAWRRRAELPPPDEVGLWLFGVARRVLANQRRTAERQGRLHLRLAAVAATAPSTGAPADAGIGQGHRLPDALARLDPDDCELLLLRAWDGLAVQDIAVLLECTPNAASLRLHKARCRLSTLLEPKEPPSSWTSAGRPTEREEDTP